MKKEKKEFNMKPIYVVHAMRWGDCEKHGYIVLATNNLDEAIKAANDCEIGRGGKYGCEVSCFNCGEKTIIRKPYGGIETAAENLMKKRDEQ